MDHLTSYSQQDYDRKKISHFNSEKNYETLKGNKNLIVDLSNANNLSPSEGDNKEENLNESENENYDEDCDDDSGDEQLNQKELNKKIKDINVNLVCL